MFLRTAWRHWRSTRALWLIMMLVCVGLQWVTGMHAVVRSDTSVDLITQGICMLFAMATPALAFSFDVETRTQPRTLMLPGSWSQVIAAITLCAVSYTHLTLPTIYPV